MNWLDFQKHLLDKMPGARPASGNKFVTCRCQECGDSISNIKSAHMYIRIPWNNDDTVWYYCHLCNSFGVIDHKKMIEWGIYNKDLAYDLTNYITDYKSKNPNKYKRFADTVYNIMNTRVSNDNKTEYKRQYVSNRLGVDLSIQDLLDLKIVLNLWDLINENKTPLTRDINIVNDLDREFMGFLSIDNAFLDMRRTVGEGKVYKAIDKRYVKYQIFDKEITAQRFYTIPTMVDLNSTERIKLHIAEGSFDILSIYLNLRNKEPGIYTSISGSNYISVIMHFLTQLKLPYLELHIYPDNDKHGDMYTMRKLMNKIPDPYIPIYIHRNTCPGEKDFGVPIHRINESIYKLR